MPYSTSTDMTSLLPTAQIVLSILLIAGILLQISSAGVGASLGGGDSVANYHTRRGFEKFLFYFTIVVGVLFALSGVLSILLRS
jgi:protein translocase SecG subunit